MEGVVHVAGAISISLFILLSFIIYSVLYVIHLIHSNRRLGDGIAYRNALRNTDGYRGFALVAIALGAWVITLFVPAIAVCLVLMALPIAIVIILDSHSLSRGYAKAELHSGQTKTIPFRPVSKYILTPYYVYSCFAIAVEVVFILVFSFAPGMPYYSLFLFVVACGAIAEVLALRHIFSHNHSGIELGQKSLRIGLKAIPARNIDSCFWEGSQSNILTFKVVNHNGDLRYF
ncbi:MAG: hypothetical protein AAFX40_15575, partial [Cyanobacteria bacterium J06639_1]